eukprot:7863505-Heterocapsa_arctica.AAC.1
MGMPWQSIMNTRQCPQNPFDQRNNPRGPDNAVGFPLNANEQDYREPDTGNGSLEHKDDYCPWSIIDAFTKTMWERRNYTSKSDKMRIGSWRTIIQVAIEQAETNKSTIRSPPR